MKKKVEIALIFLVNLNLICNAETPPPHFHIEPQITRKMMLIALMLMLMLILALAAKHGGVQHLANEAELGDAWPPGP